MPPSLSMLFFKLVVSHKYNEFLSLVYEYKSYKENENMKVLLFDDFTFANIICEELQKNKEVEFAGVNKDNYFDQDVVDTSAIE